VDSKYYSFISSAYWEVVTTWFYSTQVVMNLPYQKSLFTCIFKMDGFESPSRYFAPLPLHWSGKNRLNTTILSWKTVHQLKRIEDNLWWCLSFEEMLRESCTEKDDSTVQEAQGKMDMVVDKLQFRNLVDLWCKPNNLQPQRSKWTPLSKCVSVCVSIPIQISFGFFGESGWGLTCDCEGNRLNSNNGSMWWP